MVKVETWRLSMDRFWVLIKLVIGNTADSDIRITYGIYLKNDKLHGMEPWMDSTENFWQVSVFILLLVFPSFCSISFLICIIQVVIRIVHLAIILQRIHHQQCEKETGIANITAKIKKLNIQINDISSIF